MDGLISRQDAIDAINARRSVYSGMWGKGLSLAVDTLRALPSAQPESAERNEESKQNVPNDDLISRKMAIEKFWHSDVEFRPTQIDEVMALLKDLPSAQPEQRTGKWLNVCMDYGECSECGFCGLTTDYCPSCGADMRGEDHGA